MLHTDKGWASKAQKVFYFMQKKISFNKLFNVYPQCSLVFLKSL